MKRACILGLCAGIGLAVPALAQTTTETKSLTTPTDASAKAAAKKTGTKASADAGFVQRTAKGGVAEVELARLGVDKASHADVKAFAQQMVDDHSKANGELKDLATTKGIAIADAPDAMAVKTKEKLSAKSGDAFDKAFMDQMVSDHKKTIADFKRESKSGRDADVKAWATKTLPTLEHHLQMAEETHGKVKGTATTTHTSKKK